MRQCGLRPMEQAAEPEENEAPLEVTVVVPARNEEAGLRACLRVAGGADGAGICAGAAVGADPGQ